MVNEEPRYGWAPGLIGLGLAMLLAVIIFGALEIDRPGRILDPIFALWPKPKPVEPRDVAPVVVEMDAKSKPIRVVLVELEPVDLEQLKRDGLAFAQKRIEKGLKAPKTAEFSSEPKIENSPVGDSETIELRIDSHVDAQNSYGVPLREEWKATLNFNRLTREWSVFTLQLGDNYIEIAPEFQKLVTTLQTALEEGRAKRHANAIAHWTGTGSKKTELFRPPKGAWKVSYECDGNPFLSITISRPGTSYYENPVSESDATSGEYVVRRTGEFQLDINSSGGSWHVWIEPADDPRQREPESE